MSEVKLKKKRKRYRQRMQPKHLTLRECFESAFNEIEQLRDEMQENVDNTQESFGETQRFIDTEEALTALDDAVEQKFSGWEEHLKTIEDHEKTIMTTMYIVKQFTWLKRGIARWRRMNNCIVALEHGKDRIEEHLDDKDTKYPDNMREAMEALVEMCDGVDSEFDAIEWPRMYG